MLQPGGYQIPPSQYPYSTGGGHNPSSIPSQLQQGTTQCVYTLSCTALLLVSKLTVIFFLLTFTTTSVSEGNSISYLHLTICQSMYHVATIGGQNEWGKWDLQFRTHHIIIFHQDLPHILVCCTQVDAGFFLHSILTVDTSHHLCHHSKVLLIYDHLVVVFMPCQAIELKQP